MSNQSDSTPDSGEQTLSFEQALAELEGLVERLESGEQGLERDLADFERGINLSRQCEKQLQEAEQVVYKLVGDGEEGEHLQPFAGDGAPGDQDGE
ncbi:exodeoxyribonuclease VII small subunit [Thiohalorhabdus methylotrophus]|uniref:Exodeoxyribonuclease 7 small subunit n=1 Tax=Thiohalorhabdus methylotrophus TaxID=3242694 RepID=A0ABV4TVW4_9GAMM